MEHRVYNQQQEVSTRPNLRNRISWDDIKLSENGQKISRQKDQEHQAGGMETAQSPQFLSSLPLSHLVGKLKATTSALQSSSGSSFLLLSPDMFKVKQALETNPQNYQSPAQLPAQAVEELSCRKHWKVLEGHSLGQFRKRIW